MTFFKYIGVLAIAVSATFSQTIELGFPQNGDSFCPGQNVTARVILPVSSCYIRVSISPLSLAYGIGVTGILHSGWHRLGHRQLPERHLPRTCGRARIRPVCWSLDP